MECHQCTTKSIIINWLQKIWEVLKTSVNTIKLSKYYHTRPCASKEKASTCYPSSSCLLRGAAWRAPLLEQILHSKAQLGPLECLLAHYKPELSNYHQILVVLLHKKVKVNSSTSFVVSKICKPLHIKSWLNSLITSNDRMTGERDW